MSYIFVGKKYLLVFYLKKQCFAREKKWKASSKIFYHGILREFDVVNFFSAPLNYSFCFWVRIGRNCHGAAPERCMGKGGS